MEIETKLLKILVCPVCRVEVRGVAESGLECAGCGRVYPLRDGIRVMLAEESPPRATEKPG